MLDQIERIEFNENWEEIRREPLLRELRNRIRDVRQGPDGFLYALTGELEATIRLPDGRAARADRLAEDLLLEGPGVRLAYATDLADTEANRATLADLADGAHTLFCEASFRVADAEQAQRTGHLTTRACAEIATAAGVARLQEDLEASAR